MAGKRSAGILLFRQTSGFLEVLLAHMGGPFWAKRDAGAWSIPKGEYEPEEDPKVAAIREFQEELGIPLPEGELIELGEVRQSGGKFVKAWALESDPDITAFSPGTFDMEWPRGSGRIQQFPEIDRVEWLTLAEAKRRIVSHQADFLEKI